MNRRQHLGKPNQNSFQGHTKKMLFMQLSLTYKSASSLKGRKHVSLLNFLTGLMHLTHPTVRLYGRICAEQAMELMRFCRR